MSLHTSSTEATDDIPLAVCLDRARRGAHEAIESIYRRFARVVHGIVLGICSTSDADDVTQEVFLTVQTKIDSVTDADALPGWICAIARNKAIDHVRRSNRRPEVPLEELPSADTRDESTLATQMLGRIRELPEAYRETLTLRLVEGMSGPEIAKHTGMTDGSVRVNLHRGMAMLRERLRKDGWP